MKIVPLDKAYWPRGGFGHWCPGCSGTHEIDTEQSNASGAKWSFNGDMDRPTFAPSINCRWGKFVDPSYERGGICHYFIRDGRIEYCSDSTHALSGQAVDLPDIPAGHYVTSIAKFKERET